MPSTNLQARRQRRGRSPRKSESRNKFESMDEESEDKPLSNKINYEALEAIVGASSSHQPVLQTQVDPNSSLTPGPLLASTLLADGPGPSISSTFRSPSSNGSNMRSEPSKTLHTKTPTLVRFADHPEVHEIPNRHMAESNAADHGGGDGSADTAEIVDDDEIVAEDDEEDDAEIWDDGNDLW